MGWKDGELRKEASAERWDRQSPQVSSQRRRPWGQSGRAGAGGGGCGAD